MVLYNYFQPIYLEYTEALTKDITGYVMQFPDIEQFNLHYGEEEENAPTNSLLNVLRLLLPQIRVINQLIIDGQPNPAAFLASEKVEGKILSLIFNAWIEVCYPESKHKLLKSLCTPEVFDNKEDKKKTGWKKATSEQLEWWSPAWTVATTLTNQEYQLGNDKFKLLFAPGRKGNTVELVSWPPFTTPRGYKSSIGVVISTQRDFNNRRINIHFKMKRWVVKRGDNPDISLQTKTTHCYIRRLSSWSGKYDFPDPNPNAFITLEAKNVKIEEERETKEENKKGKQENKFESRWKDKKILEILEKLAVKIPTIEDVLANALNFIGTDKIDILIAARSWQKVGWGTGVPISDERQLLKQIIGFLPSGAILTQPWKKISAIKQPEATKEIRKNVTATKKIIKDKFCKNPKIQKPSSSNLPKLTPELKEFLQKRANNLTLHVCTRTEEAKKAIEQVTNHYFGDSLKLKFHTSNSVADPIQFKISKKKNSKNKRIPQLEYIKKFGQKNKPEYPEPIIVEILSADHPSYRNNADPKNYIKSELPKYNLVPQCIVSSEKGIDKDTKKSTSNKKLENSLLNRAFSAILDAILPFDENYPLSTHEDNNTYAGLYLISRNKATSNQSFNEPALVVIYKNQLKVLLPAQDTKIRSMPEAICYLAKNTKNQKVKNKQIIETMLNQLSLNYSNADNIYLYVHKQNASKYWEWLQDKNFVLDSRKIKKDNEKTEKDNEPTKKITIMRIRDLTNNEVAQGYGLPTAKEDFIEEFNPELASFAQGIFIAPDCNLKDIPLTQTVLSIANKAQTLSKQIKTTSRFDSYTSKGVTKNPSSNTDWKMPQPRAQNILATPSPDNFILHHAIAHYLRSAHWWSADECEYPLPLSLAKKIKEWCFSQ